MMGSEQLEPIDVQVRRPGIVARILMRPLTLGLVLFFVLLAFLYANLLYTPPLRISRETTYITEPLTSDGTRVDYFAAFEQFSYRPEMKTDDNGYRLIVRALGAGEAPSGNAPKSPEDQIREHEIYRKLGLDPQVAPTMVQEASREYLYRHVRAQGLDESQQYELEFALESKLSAPWTLSELPMMGPWIEQHQAIVALLGEAVRKPFFLTVPCRPRHPDSRDLFVYDDVPRIGEFGKILQAFSCYRIGNGDLEGGMYDLISCARLARHLQRQAAITSHMAGLAMEGIAASTAIAGNRKALPTREQLSRFVAELAALPPSTSLDDLAIGEHWRMLNLIQRVAHGDAQWDTLETEMMWVPDADANSEDTKSHERSERLLSQLSVDWNIVMREVNRSLDDPVGFKVSPQLNELTARDLFLHFRSQRCGTYYASSWPIFREMLLDVVHRVDCTRHLQRIVIAMLLYEREHGTLPPAYTTDAAGKPLHSWRTLLLPYLGHNELYAKLRLDEPWDSPHNSQFHTTQLGIYQCPSANLPPGLTSYSVVVGEKTPFGPGQGRALSNFGDRLLLVVERRQPVMWMDAASELSYEEAVSQFGIADAVGGAGSPHTGILYSALRSGAITSITDYLDPTAWQGLLDGTLDHDDY
jgi:hypothetical protein